MKLTKLPGPPTVSLIDPGLPMPLDKAYSDAVRQGRKDAALNLLKVLVPDLTGLEILTEDDGTPSLYVTKSGGAVPVGLAGDGIQGFLQLALQVAAQPGGLVLVEEPEVYQHPKAIRQTARVLTASVERGLQVVLTTHSLELIDALLDQASAPDALAVFNLRLDDGQLTSRRYSGEDAAFARTEIEEDLR